MFTIIGGDGKEYGPVTADQIRGWIAEGRANLDTKAKAVGTDEWRRLAEFPEFASPAGIPPASGVPVARPQPVVGNVDAKTYANDLLARGTPPDVFGCIGRSFDLWKSNFLPLVGVTLLIFVVQMVLGLIPVLGALAGLLLNGVFYGGLYYYYLGLMRGEPRTVGDAFAGFSRNPGSLILASLLIAVLTLALLLPFFGPLLLSLIKGAFEAQAGGPPPMPGPIALGSMFVGMLIAIYFSIGWMFTWVLIVDKGLGPWTAMEVSRRVVTRYWFRVFFVAFLSALLAMLGVIVVVIGVLFTLPLLFGSILYAYEDLCNPPASGAVTPTTPM